LARDIDPVVDPDYRGKRVFTRLLDFALQHFDDIDFFYNFANKASAPGFIKRGWHQIGPLRDYVFQTGYSSILSKDFIIFLLTSMLKPVKGGQDIKQIDFSLLADLEKLKPHAPSNRIWAKRSISFLIWRYGINPLHEYEVYAQYGKDDIVSICIARYIPESRNLIILDYVPFGSDVYSLTSYLFFFKSKYKNTSIYLWHTSEKGMLESFTTNPLKKKIGQNFLVRAFPGKNIPDFILNLNRWYVSRGDSEVF